MDSILFLFYSYFTKFSMINLAVRLTIILGGVKKLEKHDTAKKVH